MTYCVGIWTKYGLVMASDSRTNSGHDQVNVARKMHTFVQPGERVFILLSSGSLSCTQSIITLIQRDFDQGRGLAQAPSLYDAARIIGEQVRRVSDMDRDALERDDFKFNVNLVLGGQVRGEPRSRAALALVRGSNTECGAAEERHRHRSRGWPYKSLTFATKLPSPSRSISLDASVSVVPQVRARWLKSLAVGGPRPFDVTM